jgi:hypothetical protein
MYMNECDICHRVKADLHYKKKGFVPQFFLCSSTLIFIF